MSRQLLLCPTYYLTRQIVMPSLPQTIWYYLGMARVFWVRRKAFNCRKNQYLCGAACCTPGTDSVDSSTFLSWRVV